VSPDAPGVPDAANELQTRAELNRELQRAKAELERLEEQARKAGAALSSVDAARLNAAGRRPVYSHSDRGPGGGVAAAAQARPAPAAPAPARPPYFVGGGPNDPAAGALNRALAGRVSEAATAGNTGFVRLLGKGADAAANAGSALLALRSAALPAAAAFYVAERSAKTWMEALSPTAARTLDESWKNLYATLGDAVTPAFLQFASDLQKFTRWLDGVVKGSYKKPEEADFSENFWGAARETGAGFRISNPLTWTDLGTRFAGNLSSREAAAGTFGDWARPQGRRWRGWMNFGEPGEQPGMSYVPPGGGPVAAYSTGERYQESLMTAGLAIGTNDPATERLQKQLEWLEKHDQKLEGIDKNTQAMARWLEGMQAWR
jgi:hypothetical protein